MVHDTSKLEKSARAFLGAFDRGDLNEVMDFFAEAGAFEDASGQRFEGTQVVRGGLTVLFDGTFDKPRYVIEDLFCDGSAGKVLASWRCDAEMGGEPLRFRASICCIFPKMESSRQN